MSMPDQKMSWPRTPCTEYEDQILDLEQGQLSEPARGVLELHLAGCPACRQFAEELQSLDAALAREFQRKELPASFKEALLSRIDAATASVTPELVARRKAAIESEFRRQSAGLLKRVVGERWSSFLDALGLATLALVMVVMLQQMLFQDFDVSALLTKALTHQLASYVIWMAAAASVIGAVWIGLRGNLRCVVPWA